MRGLLADRDTRLLMAAQVLSALGDYALWLALGIWIKILTGSSAAAGLASFCFALGLVCSPVGGILVDRRRRRPALIALSLATGGWILPLLLVHGRGTVWIIYVVMVGYGLASGVGGGALTALTQTVVPAELLGDANGLLQTLLQVLRLATPLIGAGVLAAFGARPLVVGDLVTFVATALLLRALRVREAPPEPTGEPMRTQLTEGVRYIVGEPLIRRLTSAAALAVVAIGVSQPLMFTVVSEGLHRAPEFRAVLSSVDGAGAVAGGLLAARLIRGLGEIPVVVWGLAAMGVGFLTTALPVLPAVLAGSAAVGVGISLANVGIMTVVLRTTPVRLMGRVDTTLGMMVSAPQAAAIALGSGLVAVVDFRLLLVAITVVVLLAAGYLRIRDARPAPVRPPGEGEPAPLPAEP